jgi:uncharacterized membrane protein YgdD (TMEM256/DUF423 family)
MYPKHWIALGAFAAMTGVIVRAGLSHGPLMRAAGDRLEALLAANDMHLLHSLALIAVGLSGGIFGRSALLTVAGGLFLAGIVLFAGSSYAGLAAHGFGFLTPIGGVAQILGWFVWGVWALRQEGLQWR